MRGEGGEKKTGTGRVTQTGSGGREGGGGGVGGGGGGGCLLLTARRKCNRTRSEPFRLFILVKHGVRIRPDFFSRFLFFFAIFC